MSERKICVIICIIATIIMAIILLDCGVVLNKVSSYTSAHVLLIDPGHGGMDGGAVASDGTLEKDINLAIARELAGMASEYGWKVIMTRETDEWLSVSEEGSIRSRKTEDLQERRRMIKEFRPDIAVSIHLNSFKEDPSVNGAQVFFPATGGSEDILEQCRSFAGIMQRNISSELDSKKERTAMAKDDVMLFKEVSCPIVIIECGFLSNTEEAALLKTKEYQRKAATGIMAGITEFTGVERKTPIEIIDSF